MTDTLVKEPYEFPDDVRRYRPKCIQKECPPPPKRSNTWYIILIIVIILLIIIIIILAILYFTKGTTSSTTTQTAQRGANCSSTPCATGLTCDLNVCKPKIGTGPCSSNSDCPGASECINNICKSTFNGSCSTASDCAVSTNVCVDNRCKNPTDCTTSSDCLNAEGPQTFCNANVCVTPIFVGQGDLCDNTTLYCSAPYNCVASVCL